MRWPPVGPAPERDATAHRVGGVLQPAAAAPGAGATLSGASGNTRNRRRYRAAGCTGWPHPRLLSRSGLRPISAPYAGCPPARRPEGTGAGRGGTREGSDEGGLDEMHAYMRRIRYNARTDEKARVVPRKIRELKSDLRRAGFAALPGQGKGSHTKWEHPLVPDPVTLSGHDGDDAHPYQERNVRGALRDAREAEGASTQDA